MKALRSLVIVCFVLFALGIVVFGVTKYYSFIFARHVSGVVDRVERVQLNVSLLQQNRDNKVSNELFSFAVAIREKSGEIVTASSEDRQWAVVQKDQCVEAKYYPYPPWNLEKSGTYHNARLLKLSDCAAKTDK